MIKPFRQVSKRSWMLVGMIVCAAAVLMLLPSSRVAADEEKKVEHRKAYSIYKEKCLSCHDSVADPEKPGRTRDDWFLVVNVMHGYGFDLSDQEARAITDLLYDLRAGLEKDPG